MSAVRSFGPPCSVWLAIPQTMTLRWVRPRPEQRVWEHWIWESAGSVWAWVDFQKDLNLSLDSAQAKSGRSELTMWGPGVLGRREVPGRPWRVVSQW